MSVYIDLKELEAKFISRKSYYTRKIMVHHIPCNLKTVGDIPKKVDDELPFCKFKSYFQKTVYGLDKVLGIDATNMVKGSLYIMVGDIRDSYHNQEYDYVGYILDAMEKQIFKARAGEMK